MNYEIVNLDEKILAGLSIRTNNSDPNMTKDIGTLWEKFFKEGIYGAIQNKVNARTIGLYSNYTDDEKGDYDVTVGCEISNKENLSTNTDIINIPAGKYAKFIVKGEMKQAVGEFWQKLWAMDLDRKYTFDFEEYVNGDPENAEIHVYIGIN